MDSARLRMSARTSSAWSGVVYAKSSTLSNLCTRRRPRGSRPAEPASRQKQGGAPGKRKRGSPGPNEDKHRLAAHTWWEVGGARPDRFGRTQALTGPTAALLDVVAGS